mgnify:CR=1 FL=1
MRTIASGDSLSRSVGYGIKTVSTLLRGAMEEALRPLELTVPQYACLELLGQRPGLSNAELARGAFVTRQSMNLVLRGLQARGLVSRPATANTGRARPSELTADGEVMLAKAGLLIVDIEERMLAGMPDADRSVLLDALHTCSHNLGTD